MQHKHKAIALTALSAVLFAFGLSADYSSAAETAATNYLPDVTNLVGVAGSGSVALSWDAVANANLYTIYYGKTSVSAAGGTYESQATSETNGFVVRNLTPDTPYFFAIAAEDTTGTYAGSYNYSNEVPVTPLANPSETTEVVTVVGDNVTPAETTLPAAPTTATTTKTETTTPAKTETVSEKQEEKLPQSGPVANLVFGFSIVAAFLWVKRKSLVASR